MSDLERLTEALEKFASMTTPTGMYGSEHDLLVAAARAYRDLLANGEREWHCEYPEFNDPHCQSGMGDPQPDKTRQPRKHTQCRWVLLVDVESGEER